MGRLAAVLVLVALAAGCSAAPSFAVPVPDHSAFTINVFDQSGLVTAAQPASTTAPAPIDPQVVADPGNKQVSLRWLGGVCHFGPAVTLSGTATALHMRLEPNAGGGLPPFVSCPAAAIYLGITLTLSQRVEQDVITLEVRQ